MSTDVHNGHGCAAIGHWVLIVVVALACAGCTLDDGEPWGYVDGEISADSPAVDEAFEVESIEVEIEAVRLIEEVAESGGGGEFDPQNPPPGCSLCHGGHCHCDGELVDYEELEDRVAEGGQTRRLLARLEAAEALSFDEPAELLEAGVGERSTSDVLEVELASVRVDGTLTIDEKDYRTAMSLPGIGGTRLDAPLSLSFGADEPFERHIDVELLWAEDWFEGIDLDQLDVRDDSEITISSSANRSIAHQISERVRSSAIDVTYDEEP